MSVTLRQIRCFHVVAELGSFTRAAQDLRMTQPGLSLVIRQLERTLNVRLFERTTRQVELTDAGREFLATTQRVVHDLDDSIRNARELTDRKRGKLTVAAPPLLAATLLPAAMAEYKRVYPGIAVGIFDIQSDDVVARVKSGEVDCGIGTFARDESGLRREMLLTDNLMLWCSTRSPLARRRRISWSELKAWPLIMLTRSSNIRAIVENACSESGNSAEPRYEVSHMTTAIMLTEADLGVCPLPSYVGNFARRRKVVARPLVDPQVRREVSFIQSSNRSLTPAAEGFLPLLRKHLQSAFDVRLNL
jgi:DNA-binding transcriptional LysR family regulator